MPVVAFDTHEFIKTLAQSGMPEVQAEAISTAVMREIETALRGEIKDLRKDMDSRFIQLEQRMTIKLGSMLVVAIGVFAAIVKLV